MTYVFDTNAFIHLFMHFYLSRFPTLWRKFDDLVGKGRITSVREVAKEIESYHGENRLTQWAKVHREVFTQPTEEEMQFVGEILVSHAFKRLSRTRDVSVAGLWPIRLWSRRRERFKGVS